MTTANTPKSAGFIDRGYNHSRKQMKMEAEEKEIAMLEARARGEEAEDLEVVEEAVDVETPKETPEVEEVEDVKEVDSKDLPAEEKSFKKRYGDLRRHMQAKEKEWEDKLNNLTSQASSAKVLPPKSDEDIAAWADKYPDVASIVETIAKKKAEEMFASADTRLKEFDKISEEARTMKAENEIRDSHPDFDDLRGSDSFHDWADNQPKWVRDALYENMDDPASVVRVIDLYKIDNGLTASAKKLKTKDAAQAVGTRNRTSVEGNQAKGSFTESQVARMSMKEYEENEVAILSAQRNGKFTYDLSGGAR